MTHLGRVSIGKDDAWSPRGYLALSDAPRVDDMWPEVEIGRARVIQDGEVGWEPGKYRIALRIVDPSGNVSEAVTLDVRRHRK